MFYLLMGLLFIQYNSSPMLNNNRIIREIAHQYKSVIEDAMGGWNPRLF